MSLVLLGGKVGEKLFCADVNLSHQTLQQPESSEYSCICLQAWRRPWAHSPLLLRQVTKGTVHSEHPAFPAVVSSLPLSFPK